MIWLLVVFRMLWLELLGFMAWKLLFAFTVALVAAVVVAWALFASAFAVPVAIIRWKGLLDPDDADDEFASIWLVDAEAGNCCCWYCG